MKRILVAGCVLMGMLLQADYPIQSVAMTNVMVTGGFWLSRLETNRLVTVRTDFEKCEVTRIPNFTNAALRAWGTFRGVPFDDSDVYKVIEGAAYTLATHPDAALEAYLDRLIGWIARAQEPDGYLYTARTLGYTYKDKKTGKPTYEMMGPTRWSLCSSSHELYNAGHMYEAAIAYWYVTGKRTLLDVAIRHADLVDRTFGPGATQLKAAPGHEEIELALVKLYRATGEKRYLALARHFLEQRGRKGCGFSSANLQAHQPVTEQRKAVGHAVRAGYLYCGMTDVAALTGDTAYRQAIDALWENVVSCKMHLTGGIGARHKGEAFGDDYELPNETAYLETCAAIANALWNERMFRMTGDGKYVDVLERILYNGFLSGVSLGGDEFFYPNPLASKGGYKRSKWFGCSCCPVNVVRFMPQIPTFAYAACGNDIYVNLYLTSEARLATTSGTITLKQTTDYPWCGKCEIAVTPAKEGQHFALKVRLPGWAVGKPVPSGLYRQVAPASMSDIRLAVNGTPVTITSDKGYCTLDRAWKAGDRISLELPMSVQRIVSNGRVKDAAGRFAFECGPVVYCAEGVDNEGSVMSKQVAFDVPFSRAEVAVGDQKFPAYSLPACDMKDGTPEPCRLTLIPYFAWCHRGAGEMQTWFGLIE